MWAYVHEAGDGKTDRALAGLEDFFVVDMIYSTSKYIVIIRFEKENSVNEITIDKVCERSASCIHDARHLFLSVACLFVFCT